MPKGFAAKLSEERRNRDLSQKAAAEALDVSQALLSHYEKGIRECGLDFLIRAAKYYDVTADYLLGLSENRHGLADFFTANDLPTDAQMKTVTLYRTASLLGENLGAAGTETEKIFINFFAFSLYRLFASLSEVNIVDKSWFGADVRTAGLLAAASEDFLLAALTDTEKSERLFKEEPQCAQTLISFCEEFMRKNLSGELLRK